MPHPQHPQYNSIRLPIPSHRIGYFFGLALLYVSIFAARTTIWLVDVDRDQELQQGQQQRQQQQPLPPPSSTRINSHGLLIPPSRLLSTQLLQKTDETIMTSATNAAQRIRIENKQHNKKNDPPIETKSVNPNVKNNVSSYQHQSPNQNQHHVPTKMTLKAPLKSQSERRNTVEEKATVPHGKEVLATSNNNNNNTVQKVAIYMTTHFSPQHIEYLTKCWPAALQNLPLLQQANLMVYTSSTNPHHKQLMEGLGFRHDIIWHYYHEPILPHNASYFESNNQKQRGAIRAMMDPYYLQYKNDNTTNKHQSSWFDGYDWIIRLNPDVMIRRDEWIHRQLFSDNNSNSNSNSNTMLDAILIDYRRHVPSEPGAIHTDFAIFRPQSVNLTALALKQQEQELTQKPWAEPHLYAGFQSSIAAQRVAWLPNVQLYRNIARVTGRDCDVVHWHSLVQHCPNYFNATDHNIGSIETVFHGMEEPHSCRIAFPQPIFVGRQSYYWKSKLEHPVVEVP